MNDDRVFRCCQCEVDRVVVAIDATQQPPYRRLLLACGHTRIVDVNCHPEVEAWLAECDGQPPAT